MRRRDQLVGVSIAAFAIAVVIPLNGLWFSYPLSLFLGVLQLFKAKPQTLLTSPLPAYSLLALASALVFVWCAIRITRLKYSYWSPRSVLLYLLGLQNLGTLLLVLVNLGRIGPSPWMYVLFQVALTVAYVGLAVATALTVRANKRSRVNRSPGPLNEAHL